MVDLTYTDRTFEGTIMEWYFEPPRMRTLFRDSLVSY